MVSQTQPEKLKEKRTILKKKIITWLYAAVLMFAVVMIVLTGTAAVFGIKNHQRICRTQNICYQINGTFSPETASCIKDYPTQKRSWNDARMFCEIYAPQHTKGRLFHSISNELSKIVYWFLLAELQFTKSSPRERWIGGHIVLNGSSDYKDWGWADVKGEKKNLVFLTPLWYADEWHPKNVHKRNPSERDLDLGMSGIKNCLKVMMLASDGRDKYLSESCDREIPFVCEYSTILLGLI